MADPDVFVLPHLAIERLYLDAYTALGVEPGLAASMAAHRSQQPELLQRLEAWTRWSTSNCLGCARTPSTCDFLRAMTQGVSARHPLADSIESDPFPCPARVTTPLVSPDPSSAGAPRPEGSR